MVAVPPQLDIEEFSVRLGSPLDSAPSGELVERLFGHYEALRRWGSGLSLVGPGTAAETVERHYAESLVAIPLLAGAQRLVDLGSGAGFPGWVLAAARPDLEVWLVESRQRKALFLESVTRAAALSCTVLNARVAARLPEAFPDSIDVITIRALRLTGEVWGALDDRLAGDGRIVRWVGPSASPAPEGFMISRRLSIPHSHRAVEELIRENEGRMSG